MPISHFSMLAVQVAMKHYWYMYTSLENLNIGRTWMAEYFENKGFEMFDTSKTNYVLVKLPEKFRNKLKTKWYKADGRQKTSGSSGYYIHIVSAEECY